MKTRFWNKLIPVTAVIMIAGVALLIMVHSMNSRNLADVVHRANLGHQVLQAAEDLEFVQEQWIEALELSLQPSTSGKATPLNNFRRNQEKAINRLHQLGCTQLIYKPHVDTLSQYARQLSLLSDSLAFLLKHKGQAAAREYWGHLQEGSRNKLPDHIAHYQQTGIHHRIREVELSFLQAQNQIANIRIYTQWLLAASLLIFLYALWRETLTAHALHKQHVLNRAILQHLPDAAATTEDVYQIRKWNKAFAGLFDQNTKLRNADLRSLLGNWTSADTLALDTAVNNNSRWHKQWNLRTATGEPLVLDISFTLLKGNNGKHAGGLWIFKDITRQQHQVLQLSRRAEKLELGLKRQVDLLQQVWDKVPEGIFQTDLEGRYLHVNEFAARILTMPPSEIMGKKMWEVFPGLIGTNLETAFRTACRDGREQTLHFESPVSNKQYRLIILPLGNTVTIAFRDLSEVYKANDSVHTLSTAMMQAREEERRRISKELHDELGQQLTSSKVMFDYLTNMLQLPEGPMKQQFAKLDQQLTDAINKVRRLHRHFSYTQIEDLGLFEVMRHEAESFATAQGIQVNLNNEVEELLIPTPTAIALYHVFTEALTNIQHHAKATTVTVFITMEADLLWLKITDNGLGFAAGTEAVPGVGITAMLERMRRIGGSLQVNSEPGLGTTVLAQAPL